MPFYILVAQSCSNPAFSQSTHKKIASGYLTRVDTLKHYLALGDSYTYGQSVPRNHRFPVQVVSMLRSEGYGMAEAEIVATSGWTTADLLHALNSKSPFYVYDFVSLLIGVNNQYRGEPADKYKTEFKVLLKKAIYLAGNRPKRVFVLSIPDYSVTPFAGSFDRGKIAREIDSLNMINRQISESLNVIYLDVTEESRKAAKDLSLVATDGLHFSGKEYNIWAAALQKIMMRSLQ